MKWNKHLAIASMLTSMLSVQSGASIAKYLFHQLGPAGAVNLRVGLASVLLWLVHRTRFWEFTRQEWAYALFYGVSIGSMNLVFYYGIQRVPLGIGVTVEFIGPLGLALLTSRQATDFLWAVLAGVGIALIVPWTGEGVDPIGLVLVILAGLLWAAYIVATGKITRKMRSSDAVTIGMAIAALLVLPFGLGSGDLFHLNSWLLLLGLGVAVFSSALPFTLDLLTMRGLSAKTYSVLQSLQPAFAALSGFVFLGERLTCTQWLAVVCVILASTGAALCAPQLLNE